MAKDPWLSPGEGDDLLIDKEGLEQLFKGIKHWPGDVFNAGNDIIDLASAGAAKGLSNLFAGRPELAKLAREYVPTNMRGRVSGPLYNGETSVSASPEEASATETVGRLLNPGLWAGNQKVTSFGLRKALKDALGDKYSMEINPSKRGFLFGKAAADVTEPLKAPLDEILDTPMTRRQVNKGIAAGAAGAALGGGLLGKFATKVPAVERAVEAASVAPKYKYNSLAEYLDDVNTRFDDFHSEMYERYSVDHHPSDALEMADINKVDEIASTLKQDEANYRDAKFFYKDNPNLENPFNTNEKLTDEFQANIKNTLDEFSPQAKKEMKEAKEFYGEGWENTMITDFITP